MKQLLFFLCGALMVVKSLAQHCPWDCSGMILVETPVAKTTIYKLEPVLVDEEKRVIVDTMYGSDKPVFDRCDLLSYGDFTKQRTEKIAAYHPYEYDTFYHFAAGLYILKYNFCEYRERKLYLRYTDPKSKTYHYIEIPASNRIHLHDYNSELRGRETEEIKKALKPSVLVLSCEAWSLMKEDCK